MKFIRAIFIIGILSVLIVPTGSILGKAQNDVIDVPQSPNTSGEIRINEVMFYPDVGDFEWVELKNAGIGSVDISGYGFTDEDGNWYAFPNELPEVPAGGFVVVIFDGAGSASDDYDFSDPRQVNSNLRIMSDDPDEAGTNGTLSGTGIDYNEQTLTLTPDPLNLPLNATATMMVSLSQPAPPGGVIVQLSLVPGLSASVPPNVNIPEGATNQSFIVTGGSVSGTEVLYASAGLLTGSATINVSEYFLVFLPLVMKN